MSDGTSTDGSPGFLGSIKALLATVVAMAHNRVELLSTELEEELARLVALLLWGFTAVLCTVIGLTFLAVFVLLGVDPANRPLAGAILGGGFLAAALVSVVLARRLARSKPRPFDASLTELERDHDRLRRDR